MNDSNTTRPAHGGYDGRIERGDCVVGLAGSMATDGAAMNACSQAPERLTLRATVEIRAERNFADALMHAMGGGRVTRYGWNAGGQHVESQWPDKGSRMSRPYLVLKNAQNELVPWVPSQGDLFATDWALLPRSR